MSDISKTTAELIAMREAIMETLNDPVMALVFNRDMDAWAAGLAMKLAATRIPEQGEASDGRPDPLGKEDVLQHLHAKHHCEPGNMLGEDACGWVGCRFWEVASEVYEPLTSAAAGITPQLVSEPTCETCDGIGLVGSNHMDSGNCPDCNAVVQPSSAYLDIVFDGPPSHEAGRFVEVENPEGASVRLGDWVHREDGYWALRIPQPPSTVDGITDVLGLIDKTIDNGEGGAWNWGNHEVMEMLAEIRGKVEAIGAERR